MNLEELRDHVNELSEVDPDQRGYKDFVDETINQAINEIWLLKPWTFTFKEAELPIRPDITATSSGQDFDGLNMARRLSADGIIRELGDDFYSDTWQGQIIEFQGREVHISKIETGLSTTLWTHETLRTEDGSSITEETDWTIKHRYYRLPEDCVKLVSFTHKDQPIPGVAQHSTYLETVISQDVCRQQERTGDYAEVIYPCEPLRIQPGKKIQVNTFNSASSDAIPEGTWLELAWSFYFAGDYGPLSESSGVFQIPDTAGNFSTIVVDCLDEFGEFIATPTRSQPLDKPHQIRYEGLKKVLWYNANIDQTNGVRAGLPCWKMVSSFDPAETQIEYRPVIAEDDDYNLGISYFGQIKNSDSGGLFIGSQVQQIERRYIPHQTQQIRPFPRINSYDKEYLYDEIGEDYDAPSDRFKVAIIRYISKPYPLSMSQDPNPLPPEFDNLVIYKALENVLMKNGATDRAAYYAMKFEKELTSLERRYLQNPTKSIGRQSRSTNRTRNLFQGQRVVFND